MAKKNPAIGIFKMLLKFAQKHSARPPSKATPKAKAKPPMVQFFDEYLEISGGRLAIDHAESYPMPIDSARHFQEALAELMGPKLPKGVDRVALAALVCEVGNKHDSDAVRIEIDQRQVGYLPAIYAKDWRRALEQIGHPQANVFAYCKIAGGKIMPSAKGKRPRETDFLVELDLEVESFYDDH